VAEVVDRYAELHAGFRWHVPARFNIAEVCCTRWAKKTPDAVAIRFEHENGERRDFSYGELDRDADRLAAALRRRGVRRGDRVALVLPQRFETAVAHIAIYRLGAIAVPLSFLFGPEALEYRINDSGATLAIVDENGIDNVLAARSLCPQLATIVAVGAAEGRGDVDWTAALAAESGRFKAERTSAADPAVLIYTSGTTGPPKGALLPHRALIGNLSGFVASQNWSAFLVRPFPLRERERVRVGVLPGVPGLLEPRTRQCSGLQQTGPGLAA
jgi:acetyl-CoA synthetase